MKMRKEWERTGGEGRKDGEAKEGNTGEKEERTSTYGEKGKLG